MVLELNGRLVGFDEATQLLADEFTSTQQLIKVLEKIDGNKKIGIGFDVKQHCFVAVPSMVTDYVGLDFDALTEIGSPRPKEQVIYVNNANLILTIKPSNFIDLENIDYHSVLQLRDAFIKTQLDLTDLVIHDKLDYYYAAYQAGQISQYNLTPMALYNYSLSQFSNNYTFYNFANLEKEKIAEILAIHVKETKHEFLKSIPKSIYRIDGDLCVKPDNFKDANDHFIVSLDAIIDAYTATDPEDMTAESILDNFKQFASVGINLKLWKHEQIQKLTDYFMQYADLDPEKFSNTKNKIVQYL